MEGKKRTEESTEIAFMCALSSPTVGVKLYLALKPLLRT